MNIYSQIESEIKTIINKEKTNKTASLFKMMYWNLTQGHFIFSTFRFIATESQDHHWAQLVNWVYPVSEHPSPSVSPSSLLIMVWPVNWGLEPCRHSNIRKANNGREWNERDKMKGAYLRKELIRKSLDLKLCMLTSISLLKTHLRHAMIN